MNSISSDSSAFQHHECVVIFFFFIITSGVFIIHKTCPSSYTKKHPINLKIHAILSSSPVKRSYTWEHNKILTFHGHSVVMEVSAIEKK